ncbi:MAG: hypothetical protein MI892_06225 [Desulfobacterales bacterium]|nr:hypothetical protein [Desulfobacterales bacterium]
MKAFTWSTAFKMILVICFFMLFSNSFLFASDWELFGKKKIKKFEPSIFNIASGSIPYDRIKFVNEAGSDMELIKIVLEYTDGTEEVIEANATLIKIKNPSLEIFVPKNNKVIKTVIVTSRSVNRTLLKIYGIRD